MSFRIPGLAAFICASLGSSAFADDFADRAKITGTWQGEAKAVWVLESQGDTFHITNSQGDKKIVEMACTLGKECEVKESGRKVKVTLYFNGPKLVVVKTRGDEIVKLRFGAAETGETLELEVIPVAPEGKTETLHLKRMPSAAAVTASAK